MTLAGQAASWFASHRDSGPRAWRAEGPTLQYLPPLPPCAAPAHGGTPGRQGWASPGQGGSLGRLRTGAREFLTEHREQTAQHFAPPGSDGRKHWPRLGAGGDAVGQCGCSPSIYSYPSPAAHPGERQPGAETSPCARTSQQHPHNSQGQKQVPAPQGTDMRQNAACKPPGKCFWPQDGGKRGLSPRVDGP